MRRHMTVAWLLCGWAVLAALPVHGQEPDLQAVQLKAMQKLQLWVGEWKGSGWSTSRSGQRYEINLVEKVQSKVGGTVFLLEGRGTRKTDKGEAEVMHDGLVLVSYDAKAGRYRWQGHDLPWGAMDAEPKFVEGGFQWSLKTDERGGAIRFTIKLDQQRWHEVGEASADGKTWHKFMEMNLERQKQATMSTRRLSVDRVFHALGDPTRRAMVQRLSRGPLTASQLAAPLKISVTAVGQHVKVLEKSGLVRSEKVGRVRTCRIAPAGFALLEQWIALQRSQWEQRLDRLGELLAEPDDNA